MTASRDIFAVMTVEAPDVSAEAAQAAALRHWGVSARAIPLRGERDRNFHLRAADGHDHVIKFANSAEDPGFRDMQIRALQHIARTDPGLCLPRVVPLPDGAVEAVVPLPSGEVCRARLLSWVPGVPVASARRSAAQRSMHGGLLARLQIALADFSHPSAASHAIIWDLQHARLLRDIMFAIPHAAARDMARDIVDAFETRVAPLLPTLRRQVVHNDLHVSNVLVDPTDPDRLSGVIDFGDLALTAIVFDVAIGAVSQPADDMAAAAALGVFVGGFHAARPLLDVEVALLPLLIATRIVVGLSLASWHRHSQPGNAHFDLSDAMFERRLAAIEAVMAPASGQAVRRACGQG